MGFLISLPWRQGSGGACSYGTARISGGLFAGVYHPRSIEAFRPNVEGYGFVDVRLWGTWRMLLHLGAGWTEAAGITARTFLVVTNPGWTVAPWANVFALTNFDDLSYAQVRVGARFAVGPRVALVGYFEVPLTTTMSEFPLGLVVVAH